jgi:hypothetical protein
MQAVEFIRKRRWRKGFAHLTEGAERLCEISERRVRYEPFTLSDEQGGRCPLVAGAKGDIHASRF